MKVHKMLLLLLCLLGCTVHKKTAYDIAKVEHDKKLESLQNLQDPFYNKVADSMKPWVAVLKNVYITDQKNRLVGYGFTKTGLKEQRMLDSLNLITVTGYLDKYGWPAITDIGFFGQRAIGMTIQHAPLSIQEKYYPSLVEAYKRDRFLFETLALLEDRINMRNRSYQYYGTQLVAYHGKQVLYPVYEIDSLETRRKKLGFKMSMEDYMKLLKSEWNMDTYKSLLPSLVAEYKVSDKTGVHLN